MTEEYISAQDRIINASIEIISDSGLGSLSFKNISFKTNISEDMLYKYYLDIDEILYDVVSSYFKFDQSIFKTITSRDSGYIDKIEKYIDAFGSYYNSYYSLSAIMLHYEELLHNVKIREIVELGYTNRKDFLTEQFENAKKASEIITNIDSSTLADTLLGYTLICTLNRRMKPYKKSIKDEMLAFYRAWISTMKVK